MTMKHNKRRNSALLYECLVNTMSRALIENDEKRSNVALNLMTRHFRPGTELHREFRIANALLKSTVSSPHTAAMIVSEAKEAIRGIDATRLETEKSLLIRRINEDLGGEDVYDEPITDYRTYATIGSLFNEWRKDKKNVDIATLVEYEDALVKHLSTEKLVENNDDKHDDSDRFVFKVMVKKLNERYHDTLNQDQKKLISAYALAPDGATLKKCVEEIRDSSLAALKEFEDVEKNNRFVLEKVNEVKSALTNEDASNVNDDTIVRFMLYAKLIEELNHSQED